MVHIGSKFIHLAATNSVHGGHFNTGPFMNRQARTHWTMYQQYMNTQKQWMAGLLDKSKIETWSRTGKSFTESLRIPARHTHSSPQIPERQVGPGQRNVLSRTLFVISCFCRPSSWQRHSFWARSETKILPDNASDRNLGRNVSYANIKHGMESLGDGHDRPTVDITTLRKAKCCSYKQVKPRNATNPDRAAPRCALAIVCTA